MNKFESSEDYLERILMLKEKIGRVRSIDIAESMSFSKPSVSIAMKKLKIANFIEIDENGYIELTESGLEIAKRVYEKHEIIAQGLIKLGVNKEQAYIDSCKIEHDLSEESFQKIKDHLKRSKWSFFRLKIFYSFCWLLNF